MHYLYGSKPGIARKLVATFDSEPQLRAYVNWATLAKHADGTSRFEQGQPLRCIARTVDTSVLP